MHKLRAEELCRQFGTKALLPTAIVRLFSVYGVGARKQLLWDACGKFMQGSGIFDGEGDETRDWLHVEDAAELLSAALDRAAVDAPIVNGGSGVARTNRDVLRLLSGSFPDMREIRFTGRRRPGDPAHFHADISLTLAWGWRPQRSFEVELAAYARWFQAGAP
jgi:UDP-glucose 4-epimerase